MQFEAPAHLNQLTFAGGILSGEGTVRVDEVLDFDSGTLAPGGTVEVHGAFSLRPGRTLGIAGRTLLLAPTATAVLDGDTTRTFDSAAGGGRVINAGTLTHVGAGQLSVNLPFENRGRVTLAGGTLHVRLSAAGRYTQSETAATFLQGGRLSLEGGAYIHAAGVRGGAGAIAKSTSGLGTLTNTAVFRADVPGASVDLTNLNFHQRPEGERVVTVGAAGAGQLEPLTGGARATLAGTLRIELSPGFTPAPGQTWTIISAAGRTGEFAQLILPELGPGRRFVVNYGANQVTLQVTP